MKNKGITIISLIITIIILLILAGISISMMTGENGILAKAKSAKEINSEVSAEEKLKIAITNLIANKNGIIRLIDLNELTNINSNNYSQEIIIDNQIQENDEYAIVKIDGYSFRINNKLQIFRNSDDNNELNIPKENVSLLETFEKAELIENITNLNSSVKKLGNASVYLNNTNISNSLDGNKAAFSGDFTVDYWIMESDENMAQSWVPHIVVANTGGLWLGLHNGKYVVRGYAVNDYLTINPPSVGKWTHIAICRKDGIIYAFYNGILQNSVSNSSAFTAGKIYIGTDGSGSFAKNLYMDELRILNNQATWTSDFIVPNIEYENDYSIIYHFNDNNIVENTVTLDNVDKKIGNSSGIFNNSYIKYKSNDKYLFDADFTVDYWIKESNEDISQEWTPHVIVENTGGLWLGLHNGKYVVRGYKIDDYININPPLVGEWTHIAVCRKNGMIYVFYNGVLQGKIINTSSFSYGALYLGSDGQGFYCKNCHMDQVRIIKGTAAWTSNFNPEKIIY